MAHTNTTRTLSFSANERNLFFHILTACNLSCRHCYINKEQHGSNTLSPQVIADWLKLFYEEDKQSNVIFLGGEPTLHPDLAFAVKTARELGYHSVTIDTNGFLHHDLLNRLTPDEAVISFSLDGPTPKVNDPIRGEGVFATCTDNIKKAVKAGFEVSVIYTASALNIEALHEMPDLLHSLGVTHFFVQVVGLRGNSVVEGKETGNFMQLSHEKWLSIVPRVVDYAARLGLRVVYPKVYLSQDEPFSCAGNVSENFFVFPNGRVYLCPLCEDYPIHTYEIMGNQLVKKDGLVEENLFSLQIPEGCVMNKLLQPGTIQYETNGTPRHRISCCLLKQEIVSQGIISQKKA